MKKINYGHWYAGLDVRNDHNYWCHLNFENKQYKLELTSPNEYGYFVYYGKIMDKFNRVLFDDCLVDTYHNYMTTHDVQSLLYNILINDVIKCQ